MSARSYLYVPGDRAEMLAKAASRGADALVCDLEDAVAPDRKDTARATVAAWLHDRADVATQIWVRVNADAVADDVEAVVRPGIAGVMLAKASAALVGDADRALGGVEQTRGVGHVAVIPLIETAQAFVELQAIATGPRVTRLAIGEADLAAELGMSPSAGEPELLPLRLQLVVASAAAGLQAPIGPVATDFRDLDGLRASTAGLVRLGFRARSAIHPAQVGVINAVLTPSSRDVARARALVERFRAAGEAATTDDRGRMIDVAVIRGAEDVLARAAAAGLPATG